MNENNDKKNKPKKWWDEMTLIKCVGLMSFVFLLGVSGSGLYTLYTNDWSLDKMVNDVKFVSGFQFCITLIMGMILAWACQEAIEGEKKAKALEDTRKKNEKEKANKEAEKENANKENEKENANKENEKKEEI